MRSEKEILTEAVRCQTLAIKAVPHGDPSSRTAESGFKNKFDTLAWLLKRDPFELWLELLDEKEHQKIPLHTRLQMLTNLPTSGRIYESLTKRNPGQESEP